MFLSVTPSTKSTKFGSRYLRQSQKGTKSGTLVSRTLLCISAEVGELWPRGSPWSAKILKGVNKFVTLFSYTVWPSAMKFGSVSGLANRNLFPEFCKLWSGGRAIRCGDMHQSVTDALVGFVAQYQWNLYMSMNVVLVLDQFYAVLPFSLIPHFPQSSDLETKVSDVNSTRVNEFCSWSF